jgi:uncharacterized membrane protein
MTLVSRKLKFQFLFSGVVVLVALLVTWIIMSDSSPLYDYFLWHGGLPNTWGMTTLIPYIVSAMLAGNPHSPSIAIFLFALIVQWFLIGLLLSIPMSKLLGRSQKK